MQYQQLLGTQRLKRIGAPFLVCKLYFKSIRRVLLHDCANLPPDKPMLRQIVNECHHVIKLWYYAGNLSRCLLSHRQSG